MSAHDETPIATREELYAGATLPLPRLTFLASAILAVLGALVFLIGAFTGNDRVWHALLYNWLFFAALSSAGIAIVAVQRITTARWSRPIVRLLEGYVAFLPVAFVLLALIVTVGQHHIFPWTHEAPPAAEKRLYLAPGFFVARTLITFALITLLSLWLVWTSVRLDVALGPDWGAKWARGWRERMRRGFREERREIHDTHSTQGRLAVWLVLAFGFGWSLLSYDLSMSLDLHFQSTLYGWWFFMAGWLAAVFSWTLLTMWWRNHLGIRGLVTEHHFHDLGKLCFAFTAFWGYLTFGQYLIIWYGNLGEESHWPRLRLIDPWGNLTIVALVLAFVLPFFGLLARSAKVFLPTLAFFATCGLIGLWLVRYLETYPSLHWQATRMPFGLWELGVTLGVLGLWGLCYTAFMNAFPRIRVVMMTSPFRDQVQVPYDPETLEPLPAHE